MEDWAEIRRLHKSEKMSIKAIARQLGVARNTVRAALASDGPPKYERQPVPRSTSAPGLPPGSPPPPPPTGPHQSTSADQDRQRPGSRKPRPNPSTPRATSACFPYLKRYESAPTKHTPPNIHHSHKRAKTNSRKPCRLSLTTQRRDRHDLPIDS